VTERLPSLARGELRRVSVARHELVEALGRMARLIPQEETAEALVSVDEGMLSISVSGVAVSLPAFGTWTGEVRVSARFIRMVGLDPPAGDPLVVEVRDERLYFGTTLSAPCVEQDGWRSEVPIALNATVVDVLRLHFLYSQERLERAGLIKRVKEAESVALEAIAEAAKPLEAIGITPNDLQRLVVRWLAETAEKAR
jgi:hypothetical protein